MDEQVEAGPKLDALIAERIMGYIHVSNDDECEDDTTVYMIYRGEKVLRGTPYEIESNFFGHSFEAWSPSTDIAAAWEVVEKLTTGGRAEIGINGDGDEWHVRLYEGGNRIMDAEANTAPLAICKVALAAAAASRNRRPHRK